MPLFAKCSNLLNTYWMAKGMHGYASLDSAACILIIASILIFLVCKIMTRIQFTNAGILTYLCILLEPFFHSIRRQTHCRTVNIQKDWICTNIAQCIFRCDESQSLCQHLIITLYTNKQQSHVECIRSTHTDHSTFSTCIGCHIILKAINELSYGTNECGIDALVQIILLITNKFGNR